MKFRILDSLSHEVAEVEASSCEEAWAAFLEQEEERGFLPIDVQREPYVERFSVTSTEGEVTYQWLVLAQDEPECLDADGHTWGKLQSRRKDGGLFLRARCSRCGKYRIWNTQHIHARTGEVVPGVVTYYR